MKKALITGIKELAETIKDIVGYKGRINLDVDKPDGNKRKLLDCRLLNNLNWQPKINLKKGLMITYKDFTKRVSNF